MLAFICSYCTHISQARTGGIRSLSPEHEKTFSFLSVLPYERQRREGNTAAHDDLQRQLPLVDCGPSSLKLFELLLPLLAMVLLPPLLRRPLPLPSPVDAPPLPPSSISLFVVSFLFVRKNAGIACFLCGAGVLRDACVVGYFFIFLSPRD